MFDVFIFGKFVVKGLDVGKFFDMFYINMMSMLKVGKCCYGLMCNENGFLIDDGVVVCIDEEIFFCYIIIGGVECIYGWMEDWLQCEWWDWNVYVVNVIEQLVQIVVVGLNVCKVFEKLGGMDVFVEVLLFMEWCDGKIGDFDVWVYWIFFLGELFYEIVVLVSQGCVFWDVLFVVGEEFGVMFYGIEVFYVMWVEKGFIMIGDEIDGIVILQDLNMQWVIFKKKEDFFGKCV